MDVVRADLAVDDLDAAFDGVEVLIHLAASMRGSAQEQMASTVGGTGRLLDSMSRSQTRRLVLVSSLSVYDWSAALGTLTEDSPLETNFAQRDAYAAAKSEQERLVRREAFAKDWALTVLRPGFIWGPGHADPPCLGQKIGPIHLVFGPSTRLPLTYVEKFLASICVQAAEDPRAVGETFNVIDDDEQRAWSFLGEHLRRSGGRGWRVPVAYGLALGACRVAHAVLGKVVHSLPGLLIPRRFEARFKPLKFDNRKLRETLGWVPPLDWPERLRRTYDPLPDETATPRQAVGAAQSRDLAS